MNTKKEMKEFLLSRFENDLAFIENPDDYYAMFRYVIESCAKAQLENELLRNSEAISSETYVENSDRIQRAKERAIVTHGEWAVKAFERNKKPHTRRMFVRSIYYDIFGIELKEEAAQNTLVEPEVKRTNFEVEHISSFEDFLKKYFDAYEISGASDEWTEGWCAAIEWCKKIVDEVGESSENVL